MPRARPNVWSGQRRFRTIALIIFCLLAHLCRSKAPGLTPRGPPCDYPEPHSRCVDAGTAPLGRCPAKGTAAGVYYLHVPYSLPYPYAENFLEGFAASTGLNPCSLGSSNDSPTECGSMDTRLVPWGQLLSSSQEGCTALGERPGAHAFDLLDGCAAGKNSTDKRVIDVLVMRHPLHRLLLQFLAERSMHRVPDNLHSIINQEHKGTLELQVHEVLPPRLHHLTNLTAYAQRHSNQVARILAGRPCAPPTPRCHMRSNRRLMKRAYRKAALHNLNAACVVITYDRLYEGLMYLHQVLGRGVPDVRLVPPDYDQPPKKLLHRFEHELDGVRPYLDIDMALFAAATKRASLQVAAIT